LAEQDESMQIALVIICLDDTLFPK